MTAVFWLIYTVLNLYFFCLILHVILSWLTMFNIINGYQPFVRSVMQFLYAIIEPAARPIRRFIPPIGGIDLSVLILILAVQFVEIFISTTIQPIFL